MRKRALVLSVAAALATGALFVRHAEAHDPCISLITAYDRTFTVPAEKGPEEKGDHEQEDGEGKWITDSFSAATTTGTWLLTAEGDGKASVTVEINGRTVLEAERGSLERVRFAPLAINKLRVRVKGPSGASLRLHVEGIVLNTDIPSSLISHAFRRVFFEKQFGRGRSTATFDLPATDGLFEIEVAERGDDDGEVSIVLNGRAVPLEEVKDRRRDVHSDQGDRGEHRNDHENRHRVLEAPVLVALANTLVVQVHGEEARAVTVRLKGVMRDNVPPTLSIDEPLDGVWHRLVGSVRLSYSDQISGTDSSTLTVLANGVDVSGRFSASTSTASASFTSLYPPLTEGANQLVVSISNEACVITTHTRERRLRP